MLDVRVVTTDAGIGRLENSEIVLLDTPYPHAGAVIEQTGSLQSLASCPVRQRVPLDRVTLRAPLGRPRAVWGVGLNYVSKATEAGRSRPTSPTLYLAASSGVLAPGAAVTIPAKAAEPDYEGEIAVVVGRPLFEAAAEDVWPALAAITAAIDMTARDVMRATATPALAKSFPGFTPLGASVCEPADLSDADSIRIRTWVNEALVQDDTSAGMIFPIADLVSRLSWFAALEPGDVILTGTPAGTGQDRSCFLADSDEIRVEVDGVLPLVTRVVRPTSSTIVRARELAEPVA